jgi:protein CpxP
MMNYFNRTKWLTILVLILVALNIATVTAFWLLKDRRSGPPPPQSGVTDFLVKELGFDSVQKQQLQQLVEAHRREVMDTRRGNREAKDSFFALLKEPNITDAMLAAAAIKANAPDQQLEMITFRHFQKVRALCTAAQQQKFDHIIQQVLRMNAPPGGQQGPPPPGLNGQRPGDGPPPARRTPARTPAAINSCEGLFAYLRLMINRVPSVLTACNKKLTRIIP